MTDDATIDNLELGTYTVLNYRYLTGFYFVVIRDGYNRLYRLYVDKGTLFDKLSNMRHAYEKSNFTDASMMMQFTLSKENIGFNGKFRTYFIVVPDNSITILT